MAFANWRRHRVLSASPARGRDVPGPRRDGNHSRPQPPSPVVKLLSGAKGRTVVESTGGPSVGLRARDLPLGEPSLLPTRARVQCGEECREPGSLKTTLGKRSSTQAGEPVSAAPGP